MSIKGYNICEKVRGKLKVRSKLVGTQPQTTLNKLRAKGYIVKKIKS